MKLLVKIGLALFVVVLALLAHNLVNEVQAQASQGAGLEQVNGTGTLARNSNLSSWADLVIGAATAFALIALFFHDIKRLLCKNKESCKTACKCGAAALAIGIASLGTGCRDYDTPEFSMIESNETAFVLPLEGNLAEQEKFDSAEQLEKYKVAAKRIQITHRWNSTSRMYFNGEWIPVIKVIKVDRTPVSQQWSSEGRGQGNGIWVESSDSVGFSTGFQVVACVEEKDTAQFLYSYKGNNLGMVMNGEIRARVQGLAAEFAAQYKMDDLRTKKVEMMDYIRKDVVPFFEKKGITISTIGSFSGFSYENAEIQNSIDQVFVAQQLKNVAAAKLAAQNDVNKRLKDEGIGEADKMREIARGKKDAEVLEAEGQAAKIKLVADSIQAAASNPVFMQMKALEVQNEGLKRWNGQLPQYQFGASGGGTVPQLVQVLPALPPVQGK